MEASESRQEEVLFVEEDKVVHQSSVINVGHLATIKDIVPICNVCIVR